MKNPHLSAVLVFGLSVFSALAQEEAPSSVAQFFARGSSPESVAAAVAAAVAADPTLSPEMVITAVSTFAQNLSGVDLERAVSEIFRALGVSAPESLVAAVAAVAAKYPSLAVAASEGASRGTPGLAREVSAAALLAAPETDQVALATAVAAAASLEYAVVLEWLSDPMGWAGLPPASFSGGSGGSRPRPYSE